MSGRMFAAALLILSTLGLAACSHAGSVSGAATDYNRAIARARNEQILLNVLRASGREPLQFTAFGEIAATVNRSIGIDTVATNLITGGRDMISPTLRLGGSTVPIVRIAPLGNQEFTNGLLRPITPDVLGLFVSQGWDSEFLLPLVISEYQCPTGAVQSAGVESVRSTLAASDEGDARLLTQETQDGQEIVLTVATDRALEILRTGVAPGHRLVSVAPATATTSTVTIRQPASTRWVVNMAGLCPNARGAFRIDGRGPGSIQLRSPESIVYFLGAGMRDCLLGRQAECSLTYHKDGPRILFRIYARPPGGNMPAISVEMYGRRFWIPRLDADDTDRTLKTISFLSQLIALQTSASAVNLTPTIITTSAGQ